MRRIELKSWTSKVPVTDDDGNPTGETKEKDEDLLDVLNVLLGTKKPSQLPRGLDKFRMFNRLTKAFDKSDETGVLELEETDYEFIKDMIEHDIPGNWGMNANISEAIESFLDAKKE